MKSTSLYADTHTQIEHDSRERPALFNPKGMTIIDTICVIMLVCNTSKINRPTEWITGYKVEGKSVYYLDKEKKVLPKNIGVWKTKKL